MTSERPVALLAFDDAYRRQIFGEEEEAALARLVTPVAIDLKTGAGLPADARIVVTGWPTQRLTEAAIAAMPHLGLVAHAGGSIKSLLPTSGLAGNIAISSCAAQNAIPVAEFTVAAILFANKRVLELARSYGESRGGRDVVLGRFDTLGNYRRTVGLVGASTIGRLVAKLLKPFDLELIVADPYLSEADAAEMGVAKISLDQLFERADCVSLHAPLLPDTRHMVDSRRINAMKPGATLINTARGALVDEAALVAALKRGHIQAVIDTTWPEIPAADSPLWTLPNVLLTPHIAGSGSTELHRHGAAITAAIDAFLAGTPIPGRVFLDQLDRIA
ncbi:hydroxyacid dehydrogenase [Devosia sp. LjRoot16]|jgi:phosphoglycerate dehydrogenase-like enzyme|uniref:hydroxyacid dehydrogenase n=1 Tax=Devosia sp. LjRoot16 TaxID=3342271 RepID=UPI003ECED84C